MSDDGVSWGGGISGVRFGIRTPKSPIEAGSTIVLELICENRSPTPVWVFGFTPRYPRSLRVSPPKHDRPWIRVSFGDVNVLHPPDAFTRVPAGGRVSTGLDLSFAFDRRGAGVFPILFAYDPVRGAAGMRAWVSPDAASSSSGKGELTVTRARTLEEAGIHAQLEQELDALLVSGDPSLVERLRAIGPGGARFAARRLARVLSHGSEAVVGWRALDALELLGPSSLDAIHAIAPDLPHAATALEFAHDWLGFRTGALTPPQHLPFVAALDMLVQQPDRRGNFVLSWTAYDSPVHGSSRMEIFGNGDRIVVVRPAGAAVPSTRRTMLSPMHMQALFESLRFSGVWLLRPLRREGLPDEPRPALEVQLQLGEPFTRRVGMWNGEWRQGPGFRLADLLDRLTAQVRMDAPEAR
ncbi:MAG: hypothetical protein U0353_33855 [Sandaracinus sp.]